MSVIQTWFGQDLQKAVKVNHIDGNLFSHNGNGNSIGVRVYNDGEPVTLTGTVSGYVITSDGSTVPCVGARSGNEATITIPPAAYQPGNAFITIFLTDGSTVTTLCAVQTTVLQARTGSQVSPGSVVTDWTQTINAAMQSVEDTAENLGGIIATPYASLTYPVPLGKYTYYNSNLYRCISPIETSEEFTAAHWIQVKLGDDVSALKSAIDKTYTFPTLISSNVVSSKYINIDGGGTVNSSAYVCTDFIALPYASRGLLIQFNSWFGYGAGYAFYDDNKVFIEISYPTYVGTKTFIVKIPNNARYFRATLKSVDYNSPSDFSIGYQDITNAIDYSESALLAKINTGYNSDQCFNSEMANIPGGLELGDFYNGTKISSTYRMLTSTPFSLSVPSIFTTDWFLYTAYIWENDNGTWTGKGWKTADYILDAYKRYTIVIARKDFSTTDLTEDEQANIESVSKLTCNLWNEVNNKTRRNRIITTGVLNIVCRMGWKIYNSNTPPQGSVESFSVAYKHGFDVMLADVYATSDKVFVIAHDDNISDIGALNEDGTQISGTVKITESTITELDEYDFGLYKGARYAGYKIPRLEEFLKFCKIRNCKIILEMKDRSLTSTELNLLLSLINKYGMMKNILGFGYVKASDSQMYGDIFPNISILYDPGTLSTEIIDYIYNCRTTTNNSQCLYLLKSNPISTIISAVQTYGDYIRTKGMQIGITEITSDSDITALSEAGILESFDYISMNDIDILQNYIFN